MAKALARVQLPINPIRRIRQLVIADPTLTLAMVIEKLGDDHPTEFVVAAVMEHTRETLRECRKMGRLKSE